MVVEFRSPLFKFMLSLTDPYCFRQPSTPTSLALSSPPISQALLPCLVTSHLSEVLFWPDAVPLLGSQAGAVATERSVGNSQASSMLQTLALQGWPGRVWQREALPHGWAFCAHDESPAHPPFAEQVG